MKQKRLIELLIKALDWCIYENWIIYMDSHDEEKKLEAMLMEKRWYVYK